MAALLRSWIDTRQPIQTCACTDKEYSLSQCMWQLTDHSCTTYTLNQIYGWCECIGSVEEKYMVETMRIVSQTQRQAVSVRFYPLHCEYRSNSANKQEIKTSVKTTIHLQIKYQINLDKLLRFDKRGKSSISIIEVKFIWIEQIQNPVKSIK